MAASDSIDSLVLKNFQKSSKFLVKISLRNQVINPKKVSDEILYSFVQNFIFITYSTSPFQTFKFPVEIEVSTGNFPV